jgi:hypothetical protein
LAGVACPTASKCFAVGTLETTSCECRPIDVPVVATGVLGKWSDPLVLNRTGVYFPTGLSGLQGISCARGVCVAVGSTDSDNDNDPVDLPIAYAWSSGKWTGSQEVFGPLAGNESEGSSLGAVSCATPQHCAAVGMWGLFVNGAGPTEYFPYASVITPH